MKYKVISLCVFFLAINGMGTGDWKLGINTEARDMETKRLIFLGLATKINADLLAYALPKEIEKHLSTWGWLKDTSSNMPIGEIDRIRVTSKTALELAQIAALANSREDALKPSTKVQFADTQMPTRNTLKDNYINAQLNHEKICNFLGIKSSLNF